MPNVHRCVTQVLRSNAATTKCWSSPSLASPKSSGDNGTFTVLTIAPVTVLKIFTTSANVPRGPFSETIPAKNGGTPGGGSAVLVAGLVRLAVAVLAVPAMTAAASAAEV